MVLLRENFYEKRWDIQQKRTDPEAMILKEVMNVHSPYPVGTPESHNFWEEKTQLFCQKLGGISTEEFYHKLFIFVGRVEDDEREWRERKYGKE